MNLLLNRDVKGNFFTLGELFIDGVSFCYTVEDIIRPDGEKVVGRTAIPFGIYKVVLSMSNRFKIITPEVLDVKGFKGIRIHSGNTAADTEGCLIVGTIRTSNGVGLSRQCFKKLMDKLKGQKEINLTII